MKRYRLALTFVVSLLLHALLLAFLIHSNTKGFKKGTGDNPKIKISSFEFAQFDSKAQLPSNPLPQQQQKSSSKQTKNKPKNKEDKKPKPPKETPSKTTQAPKQDAKDSELKENQQESLQESSPQDIPNQTQDLMTQTTPQIPIEQTFSYQLADTQTKKIISEFYGAEFGQLGREEQEYILNNLAYIGRITQSYLRYPPNAGMLAQSGGNVVEFYLHPNGDISDLKIIKPSGFILLDRNSIKTIEIAYKDYPHPKSKTLIRFYINYYLIRR
ncbi:energy transducer TonB [Helicobacter pametensis]|uniref:energy transducer TonB n=1 Tax=Helicobacter pametensis TaxID=95149 RepID=UPI0004839417|nr:energy transducer TonB [Helicobacter pametensis]